MIYPNAALVECLGGCVSTVEYTTDHAKKCQEHYILISNWENKYDDGQCWSSCAGLVVGTLLYLWSKTLTMKYISYSFWLVSYGTYLSVLTPPVFARAAMHTLTH